MLALMTHGRTRTLSLTAAMVVAVATACGTTDQGVTAGRSDVNAGSPASIPNGSTPETSVPDPLQPPPKDTTPAPVDGGIISFGDAKTPQPYDNFLNAAFSDITQFWADNFETLYGAPFEPVSAIYAHYPERGDLPGGLEILSPES